MSRSDRTYNGYDDNYQYRTSKRGRPSRESHASNDRGFSDVSSYSHQGRSNPRRKKSAGRRAVQVILAVIFSLLIVLGAGLIYVSTYILGDLNTTTLTKDPAQLGINPDIVANNSIKNIALFGVDDRTGNFSGLSDSIIIMSIDMKHNKIKLASVLRDSYVYIEGNGENKINAAYSWGGYELAIKTLNQNFNLDIMDYVTVNFGRLADLIDAVGGVDVEITEEEMAHANGNMKELAREEREDGYDSGVGSTPMISEYGAVHLSGHQAVGYARIRYIDSDFGRANRQQNVLEAMFQRVLTMNKLEYPNMIKQMMPLCETNMGFGDVLPIAQVALSNFTIERMTIPNSDIGFDDPKIDGEWVITYDVDAAANQLDAFINEEESSYYNDYYGTNSTEDTDSVE